MGRPPPQQQLQVTRLETNRRTPTKTVRRRNSTKTVSPLRRKPAKTVSPLRRKANRLVPTLVSSSFFASLVLFLSPVLFGSSSSDHLKRMKNSTPKKSAKL